MLRNLHSTVDNPRLAYIWRLGQKYTFCMRGRGGTSRADKVTQGLASWALRVGGAREIDRDIRGA